MSKTSSALATSFLADQVVKPVTNRAPTAGDPGGRGRRWTAAQGRLALSRPRARVLVADADTLSRRRLSRALRSRCYDVLEQLSGPALLHFLGTQLLRRAGRPSIDAMIVDARMPGADGLVVLVTMQRMGWRIPIILVSTPGDATVHTRGPELGALAVLNKPLDVDEVTGCLSEVGWELAGDS